MCPYSKRNSHEPSLHVWWLLFYVIVTIKWKVAVPGGADQLLKGSKCTIVVVSNNDTEEIVDDDYVANFTLTSIRDGKIIWYKTITNGRQSAYSLPVINNNGIMFYIHENIRKRSKPELYIIRSSDGTVLYRNPNTTLSGINSEQ
jgi:hypothetical protein